MKETFVGKEVRKKGDLNEIRTSVINGNTLPPLHSHYIS